MDMGGLLLSTGEPAQRHLRVHGVVLALRGQPWQVRGHRVHDGRNQRPSGRARTGFRAPRPRHGKVR